MKRTALKRKGGRLFPQSPEDKAYWEWFIKNRSPCDVCGYNIAQAAHLTKRSSGGKDRNNLVWLCPPHPNIETSDVSSIFAWKRGCHERQEGRTDAFILKCGKDLWETAKCHTRRYDNERPLGATV